MHEMSVALEIGRIAEQQVGPGGAASVTKVAVDVGDDAGVEVSSLVFCLEAVLAAPPFAGARPEITRLRGDVLRVAYLEVDDGRPDD
jgi:Zn finger protein HypA/HybF involved in hydrogenase expression